MFERLHHVQLAMPRREEAGARAFYAGVLGLVEVDKPPVLAARGGAWFRAGGVELHLGVEDDFRPARNGHPPASWSRTSTRSSAASPPTDRPWRGTRTSQASVGSTPTTPSATGSSSCSWPSLTMLGWDRCGFANARLQHTGSLAHCPPEGASGRPMSAGVGGSERLLDRSATRTRSSHAGICGASE